MYLQVTMRPLEPFFLPLERSSVSSSISSFQRSRLLPSQSALFGVLRYLGIENPRDDFALGESAENVGGESFDMMKTGQSFGRIRSIGPLTILDSEGRHLVPAPLHLVRNTPGCGGPAVPCLHYTSARTSAGLRWLPEEEGPEENTFLCLETGLLEEAPFDLSLQTVMDRRAGLLTREQVMLRPGCAFSFTAQADSGFTYASSRTVQMARASFAAEVREIPGEPAPVPSAALRQLFPAFVLVDGRTRPAWWAAALSDFWYSGNPENLRSACCLMLARHRTLRVLTTDYGAQGWSGRRRRSPEILRLTAAGSVFLFEDAAGLESFLSVLQSDPHFAAQQAAGYGSLYCSS